MKKFKIKNRPKRKYVRKQVASSFSLSKTATFGLIPSILVAIALVTTVVISSYPAGKTPDFGNISISLPALSFDGFSNFVSNIFSAIVGAFASLHAPTLSQPQSIHTALPHIDIAPFFRFLALIQTLWKTISSALVNFFAQIVAALDPLPAIETIGHSIVTAGQIIASVFLTIAQVCLVIVTELLRGIGYVAITIFNSTIAVFWAIVHFIALLGQGFVALLIAIAKGIIFVVSAIISAIATFFHIVWEIIMIPFVAFHHLYLQAKPFLDYIGNSVKKSLSAINDGLNGWSTAASYLTQNKPQN